MVAAVAVTLAVTVAIPAQAETDPAPYGRNDAGGFRNVLPAGQHGVDNAADLSAFFRQGVLPRHWADQQPLYENLVYGSATLTNRTIGRYFKDATFGVPRGQVESRISPRRGLTIVRDADYGVPHIYGRTRSATMFGAGYAAAADRLFLMDVLRHTGRARLSSFLGGASLGSDEAQWRAAPYTEADLRRQVRVGDTFGAEGRRARRDLRAYVAGVNRYIAHARKDADLMPVEYGLIGQRLRRWRATDVIATASLIGGIFGKGGGQELRGAQVLRALEARFGRTQGRRIWLGFRSQNDPEAPVTAKRWFPYGLGDAFAPRGLALPRGRVTPARVVSSNGPAVSAQGTTQEPAVGGAGGADGLAQFGAHIRDSLRDSHASNWELVAGRSSTSGRPLAVMGPQVGYFIPQILLEMDLHGPGIDARGAAFAGVNLFVLMGHGRDYAWSATSAGSDNVDTFAEVLCGGDRLHYRYRGKCRSMRKLTIENTWAPNVVDSTPAGSAKLTAYRTVHGIVNAYGRSKGRRVAYVTARTTYMHEAESVIGFSRFNDPRYVRGPRSFQRAASAINFTFNWAYADANRTAYFLSGAYPRRAPGTSATLPVLGTGRFDWRDFDPRTRTQDEIGFRRHPKVVDPRVLVSWNNKPAHGWSAADDQWGYGPIYRSQLIQDKIKSQTRDGGRLRLAQLVQAMQRSATQDIRAVKLLPVIMRAVGRPANPRLQAALSDLREWRVAGGHRRDLDRDGVYEHNSAVMLMDAWWPLLVRAQFRPTLGERAFTALQSMIGFGASTGGPPDAPGFADGWWGYVSKDLRTLFTPNRVRGEYPRAFCGRGDRQACRSALRESLLAALSVTPEQMYGFGACADDPQPSCYDKNRWQVTAAINKPDPFPFQNRPTFQQVVSVRRDLG